jgi:hypothetical protein
MNKRGKGRRTAPSRRRSIRDTERSSDEAIQQSARERWAKTKGAAKTRIGRTYETPIGVYLFRTGRLDEPLGETASLLSVPRNVAAGIVLRFQRELAFGLEEKSDRIACHPALWPLEG